MVVLRAENQVYLLFASAHLLDHCGASGRRSRPCFFVRRRFRTSLKVFVKSMDGSKPHFIRCKGYFANVTGERAQTVHKLIGRTARIMCHSITWNQSNIIIEDMNIAFQRKVHANDAVKLVEKMS